MRHWMKALALAVAMLAPSMSWGQNGFYTDNAWSTFPLVGQGGMIVMVPQPNAQVRVCEVPAVGSPCINTADGNVFDTSGNPIFVSGGNFGQLQADNTGRFVFGCNSGSYTLQIAQHFTNTVFTQYLVTCSLDTSNPNPSFTTVNATSGYTVNGLAPLNTYMKGTGTVYTPSNGAASGTGTCTNQVVTSTNSDAAPTCATVTSAMTSGTFAPNTHNLLSASHGDTTPASAVRGDVIAAVGATPTWQRVAHGATTGSYPKWNGTDIVASTNAASGTGSPTTCTNQFVTAFTLNSDAAPTSTCTTASLTSAQFANQGTSTTVFHGNASGNGSFGAVNLTAEVSGLLPTTNMAATVAQKNFSADQVVYVSPSGSNANDGLSPGTAKLTLQAAFDLATTSGTVAGTVIAANGTYTCPTTWYSNLTFKGWSSQYGGIYAAAVGGSGGLSGVKLNCAGASVTFTGLVNMDIEGIEFNFNNTGFGVVFTGTQSSTFRKVSITQAGGNGTGNAALLLQGNGTVQNPAKNTAFNKFYDIVVEGPSGATAATEGVILAGLGAINAGTFATDNNFYGLTITGSLSHCLRFGPNSDTNRIFGLDCNNDAAAASGDAIVVNNTVPGSEQDADNEVIEGGCWIGQFNHVVSIGASTGNHIQMCSLGANPVVNVLGGAPSYVVEWTALPSVVPVMEMRNVTIKQSSVVTLGNAPTCSVTGAGTGATCAVATGSTNFSGLLSITAGTTATSVGNITVTFNGGLGTNGSDCVGNPTGGTANWQNGVTWWGGGGASSSTTAAAWQWVNAGVALTNGSVYDWVYTCTGR